ncbi:hypothetical protein QC761_601045 [Podospora bellae-mahoneyi]|uniref:Uncharacterized protein n=1 Tax=Podospora bellae-mahoneyi TaxID=2093777 RepID=A0ABR0FB64_9PEZI|nr:hypothetical protein QC761_601045 [Podospora bellae-mahoneyi]
MTGASMTKAPEEMNKRFRARCEAKVWKMETRASSSDGREPRIMSRVPGVGWAGSRARSRKATISLP